MYRPKWRLKSVPKKFWKIRSKLEELGTALCRYRLDGSPRVRTLRIALDRDSGYALLYVDGKKHFIPMEVLRILQSFVIDGL